MESTTGLDIAVFGITVAGMSLATLIGTAREDREDAASPAWRRPGGVAVRYGLSIGILASVVSLASWGIDACLSDVLHQADQNAVATPGLALLYVWLGVSLAHAPLAGFTTFRPTRRPRIRFLTHS